MNQYQNQQPAMNVAMSPRPGTSISVPQQMQQQQQPQEQSMQQPPQNGMM